jgi:hypothetical protein
LIIEEMEYGDKEFADEVLDKVFELIGSRILTLKIDYEVDFEGQMFDIFMKLPNVLYVSILPMSSYGKALPWSWMDFKMDHPLRAITILLDLLDGIFDHRFLNCLKDPLNKDRVPNIRNLR